MIVMRTGFFLLLSVMLHATAMSYTVLFPAPRGAVFVPVTLLVPPEDSEGIAAGGGASGALMRPSDVSLTRVQQTKSHQAGGSRRELVQASNSTNEVTQSELNEPRLEPIPSATPIQNQGAAGVSGQTEEREILQMDSAGFSALAGAASPISGVATGGGKGDLERDGYGTATWKGSGGAGVSTVGVTYAYNPKPEYPDSARREGREGTVVLSVLVDEEGRSRSLEVNHSSGFEVLDQAAVQTVRRWRFHPARYGDKRVESWVKIPIVFRLADARD
jgi:TonB family protein